MNTNAVYNFLVQNPVKDRLASTNATFQGKAGDPIVMVTIGLAVAVFAAFLLLSHQYSKKKNS